MKELQKVLIGTRTLPLRVDLNVIEEIEERYGTEEQFEQELLGWHFKRDEDGKYARDENGDPIIEYTTPSTKALIDILPLAINEGMRVEARRNGTAYEPVAAEEIIEECEVDRNYLREMIWNELQRNKSIKKPMPSEKKSRRKTP